MNSAEKQSIVIICGPTASGKTGLSLELAERLRGEIVGADSLQVYRHLDIGTAKPSAEELSRVRHHLVDVLEPGEPFDAAQYKELATKAISEIALRGGVPIVVGGTGLYLRILTRGVFRAPAPDPEIRAGLRRELEEQGVEYLHQRLALVDPALAEKVSKNDPNRIMRGLEVHIQTGLPLSVHQSQHAFGERPYRAFWIGVNMARKQLYQRIELRAKEMIEGGLIEEYRALLQMGCDPGWKPLQSLGYRQVAAIVEGRWTVQQALDDMVRLTKRYAKRQFTWFKKEPGINWVSAPESQLPSITEDLKRFLGGQIPALDWCTESP